MTYRLSLKNWLMQLGLAMAIFVGSLTLSACNSSKGLLPYNENMTTSKDRFVAKGETVTAEFDGVLIPFERYVWLLTCENKLVRHSDN